jgi:transcriptional regulator GlxA family with amidase domain
MASVRPPGVIVLELSDEFEDLAQWLRQHSQNARRTASVCSGAFVLAQAGLLDGKRAVTHWAMCDTLKERFPSIAIDMNAIYIEDGSIWTCAGYSACIDLALALVKADCGHDIAMKVARELVVFLNAQVDKLSLVNCCSRKLRTAPSLTSCIYGLPITSAKT